MPKHRTEERPDKGEPQSGILRLLPLLIRPLARFCIRHSLHIQDLVEAAKAAFVQSAAEELRALDERVNISRLAAITGLQRREVERLWRTDDEGRGKPRSVVSRVLGQWLYDPRFCSKPGRGRILRCNEDKNEFRDLVAAVSKDLNPGTILFELDRLSAVKHTRGGLRLNVQAYTPDRDVGEGLRLLGADIDDLMQAVEGNIWRREGRPRNVHAKTEFDNVDPAAELRIRQWLFTESKTLHARLRDFLSRYDRDLHPRPAAAGKPDRLRVAFGSFSVIHTQGDKGDAP